MLGQSPRANCVNDTTSFAATEVHQQAGLAGGVARWCGRTGWLPRGGGTLTCPICRVAAKWYSLHLLKVMCVFMCTSQCILRKDLKALHQERHHTALLLKCCAWFRRSSGSVPSACRLSDPATADCHAGSRETCDRALPYHRADSALWLVNENIQPNLYGYDTIWWKICNGQWNRWQVASSVYCLKPQQK